MSHGSYKPEYGDKELNELGEYSLMELKRYCSNNGFKGLSQLNKKHLVLYMDMSGIKARDLIGYKKNTFGL